MNLIEIKNVSKNYGDFQALNNINLNIKAGQIISLLGANGAGKTTLSSILATLHPATTGEILFEGQSIYKKLINYRMNIGFCPQSSNLNDQLTLKENLVFAGKYYNLSQKEIDTRLNKLVRQFELERYLDKKPRVLSGGYKQRFMIARSLINQPKLIILDEPTVALDPHVRRELWEFIKELKNNNISVILTTHYLDEAEVLSDLVCLLDKGKIKLLETPQKLMADFKKGKLEDVFLELLKDES